MTSQPPPRKFMFDTVFEGANIIEAPRPRRAFTPEEMEAARAEAYAEGERSAVAVAEAAMAASLQDIAQAVHQAMGALSSIAHEHRVASAELSMACARRIADAAMDAFPHAPAEAALSALSVELAAAPRIIIRAAPDQAPALEELMNRTAEQIGLTGQILVRPDPALPRAAFGFDWGDGRAQFNPEAAAIKVQEALANALAAEGLHGDPIVLDKAPLS
jgi:flagellar assembly protein FliH